MKIWCDGVRCERILNVRQRQRYARVGEMMEWDVIKILITWNWSCRCRRRGHHHHRELLPLTLHGHQHLARCYVFVKGAFVDKKIRWFSHSTEASEANFSFYYSSFSNTWEPTETIYITFFSFCSACGFSTEKIVVLALFLLCGIQLSVSNFNRNYASRTAHKNCNALENEIVERRCCCCRTLHFKQAADSGRPTTSTKAQQ